MTAMTRPPVRRAKATNRSTHYLVTCARCSATATPLARSSSHARTILVRHGWRTVNSAWRCPTCCQASA